MSVNPVAERYSQAEDLAPGDVFRWFSELHLVLTRPSFNNSTMVHFETLRLDDGTLRDWNGEHDLLLAMEGA